MNYLGQHFLKNTDAIKKIIAALDIQPGEIIIEVGPGKGALTLPLVENSASKIIAIEKDEELADELILKIKELGLENIEIIKGDALKILPELISKFPPEADQPMAEKILPDLIHNSQFIIPNSNYKIVGNIPYYITGKLLRTISELKNKPQNCVLMVQKEVAERISGTPPQNNLLAAATSIWADVKIILKLKAAEFDPPPEVDSAVIKLTTKIVIPASEPGSRNLDSRFHENDKVQEQYYKLIHIIFKQPRKTLANNLKDGLEIPRTEIESLLNSINLPLNSRPQDISVENILELAKKISL